VTPIGGTGDSRLDGAFRRAESAARAAFERDALVLTGLLVLAALVRFVGLEARGRFDGDQGHDVLVLLQLVRDGSLPLLGPPTSIGDFHHGAAYYYLLAPVAWLSGANPTAIVAWIAALGVAAVGVTWWFARSVGGRVTAVIAGLLMAVSPAAIEESTFIWNPNPIPLFAALALGCAWRAHSTGGARWWIPAILAAGMVVQLHVLGIVFLPPILALALTDIVRAWRSGDGARARALIRATAAGLALAALLFVPLVLHELETDFGETRRALAYFSAGGGGEGPLDPFEQVVFALFRVIGWPLVGLITDAPVGAIVTVSVATVLAAWLMLAGRGPEGTAGRWLGFTVLWGGVALARLAPSLQTVVAGLPNDHYHAFLDPVVFVLVALAARSLARGTGPGRRADVAARTIVAVALVALVLLDVRLWPPSDPNGGWPAARAAGARIVAAAGGGPIDVRGLPIFKTSEGVGFPVIAAGGETVVATDRESAVRPLVAGRTLAIACDRLFEEVIGDPCGGPAEDRYLSRLTTGQSLPGLVERFDLSTRVVVSIYGP
jgi:4-amino-4-deoxy-L-arabinose transferase-like glycosyltransferase